ncbi:MAG: signal peptide peptidase SppA [Marinilabiliales bacterium]|nr:MAG: signal peptide peptidase SppA [Marinilabiliales bacterium]
MKSFFKFLLASVLGVFIALMFIFFIFLGIIGVMISSADKPVEVSSNTVLHMKLDQPVVDRASKNPFDGFDYLNMRPVSRTGLYDILENIEKAKNDDNIEGIFIEISFPQAGISTLGEIRDALEDFRESGKFILAYADYYTQAAYYLASVADHVYMTPTGQVMWAGLRSEIMFFKGALEKLGIEPQIIRHGEFKSAVEPFMYDRMSDENREQVNTYLSSIWNVILEGVSRTREIPVARLDEIADRALVRSSETALEHGLVDELLYRDQVLSRLRELAGLEEDDDIKSVSIAQYTRVPKKREGRGLPREKLAIVFAEGAIGPGEGSELSIGSVRISRALREARKDTTVKAIVFRVNSPGGSALDSEVIWREVELAANEKPVIVSMGDLAASGGYYIAAPATKIVANPHTITGSIGVFGMLPDASGFLNDKLGITVDVAKTNEFADMGSLYRPLTPGEREILQQGVEEVYRVFTQRVAEGRGIDAGRVDEIGQGRVWSGYDARELGLVDEFGGLTRAVEIAVEEAGLEYYRVLSLPTQKDPFEELLKNLGGSVMMRLAGDLPGSMSRHMETLRTALEQQGIQARMPFDMVVY